MEPGCDTVVPMRLGSSGTQVREGSWGHGQWMDSDVLLIARAWDGHVDISMVLVGVAHMRLATSMLSLNWRAHSCHERGARVLASDVYVTQQLTIVYACLVSRRRLGNWPCIALIMGSCIQAVHGAMT